MNEILLKLLNMRGVEGEDSIKEFLSDSPKLTYDPLLLPDMDEGTDLILSEIEKGSKVMIYGDYDADGITSTTLMLSILSKLMPRERIDYYIPSRFEEGYGLNKEAIKNIADRGFDFLITVDCGSVSKDEVEYANELGLKVVVTDHHTITDKMAPCPLINPKKPGSEYPFQELSGCGVAFKVAQVLQKKTGLPKTVLNEVLDLVAIGTIGDIMPLVDENRTMIKYGLKTINRGNREGLNKLIEGANLKKGSISSENVGYIIVPHLNASGRIEDASLAVKLLSATKSKELDDIVRDILFKNQERKRIQNETFKHCLALLPEDKEKIDDFILLKVDDAHEGIAGIVAGKIKEEFHRPCALVIGEKGTSRSIDGVDLYSLLKNHEELFTRFGGHKGACGFTIPEENFEKLKIGIAKDMAEIRRNTPDIFVKKAYFDMEIDVNDVSIELAEEISKMEPFGKNNPRPIFKINNVNPRDIRYMGNENQHARFYAGKLQCVCFLHADELRKLVAENDQISFTGSIELSMWQGEKRLQFVIEELLH